MPTSPRSRGISSCFRRAAPAGRPSATSTTRAPGRSTWAAGWWCPRWISAAWTAHAHAALEGEAVFGYVGDALALRVDLRVGYEPTDHPRVYGLWRPGVSPERRRRLAERVATFGPF